MDLKKIREAVEDYKKVFELNKESLLQFLYDLKFENYQDFCKKVGKRGLQNLLSKIPPDHVLHDCFNIVQRTNL